MFCCSGKILHIDFGDCFEASMNREKFPEKVSQFIVINPHFCGFLLVPVLNSRIHNVGPLPLD
jgi:hypothetical protein